ncbi:Octanoyltransferase [Zhongshania aliphaticivorans]|uniref:Octanoyltransferase n=1 Tax=Zhongshania aliphaticivorans TaxID=1470434 RepID=A0A5S9NV81_9GAMM|nr:lipoyl(octanoyl) transferase LipB [Zhongshania aliphaticivorans]CAA0094551.1 Octanoyltransferase [Zhongshania aliphaticivorans]CAA0112557.1 Octanoyltransferase [Zhongshania aliphaticivorans]
MSRPDTLWLRQLGRQPYEPVWHAMQAYTDVRDSNSPDELWFLEHDAVFTQGQAGKAEHILMPGDIPIVQVDRGGQVTYHGPGQLVGYILVDLRRLGMGIRELVTAIESSIVNVLADLGIPAHPRADAPGVYVDSGAKIAQLGLRVRRGSTFHGLSLNIDMDLSVFQRINPCGHQGMVVTDIRRQSELEPLSQQELTGMLSTQLADVLGYKQCREVRGNSLPDLSEV